MKLVYICLVISICVFAVTCPNIQAGDPIHGIGSYAAFSFDVLATPKWDSGIKVHGFSLTVNTYAPKGATSYDACVYVQYKRGTDEWKYVPAAPTPAGIAYRSHSTGGAYEIVRVSERKSTVSFFIPHEVLNLKEGDVDLRFLVKFFVEDSTKHVEMLDRPIAPIEAIVKAVHGRIINRRVVVGSDQPPVRIWDVKEEQWMAIRP